MATILIVDDSPTSRQYMAALLDDAGHHVIQARDGAECLQRARLENPDLIIADILMPNMDGYEFVRQLRAEPAIAQTPVIFCTGHFHDAEARSLASACGVSIILDKPGEPEQVIREVDRALRQVPAESPIASPQEFDREHLRLLTDMLSKKVTALTAANERLRERDNLYRLLTDNSNDLIYLLDIDGHVVYASPSIHRLGGADVEQVIGASAFASIHPEDLDAALEAWSRVVAGKDTSLTLRLQHADGTWRWIEMLASAIQYRGHPHVMAVGRDLTERKQSEAQTRLLLDSTAEAIYGIDLHGQCTFSNSACARFLGYAGPRQLLGKNMHALIHHTRPDGTPYPSEECPIFQAIRAGIGTHVVDEVLWRADGSSFPAEYWSYPIRHDDQIVGAVITFLDITERKKLEEQFRQAQRRLQHVVSSSPAVLYTLAIENDQVRGITWISDNVLDMLGYPESEIRGAHWWMDHVHPDDVQPVIDAGHQDLFSKGVTVNEYRIRHRDGTYHWVRGEIRLLRDAAGKPIEAIGSWTNFTEHKQLEEQYRQAQKMEAVGRLAGGVAHDFNNLLTVIMGYSEIYLGKLRPEDPLRIPLTEIHKAGERAAGLTRQLLAFSRKQVLMPVVLDLNTIIADMEKMLRRLIGEDVILTALAGTDLWKVKADPGQLEQVVMNILVNARDAMAQGGKLLLETRNVEIDDSYVHTHPEAKLGGHVLLAISDTGCGMDRAVKARIFEPFFTTKGPTKGTGLGLATVFGIVKQSGGHIEVYSEVGQGTTFKIYLPRDTSGEPIAASPRTKEPLRGGTETILLVEDEEGVRALAQSVLQENGYTVLDARHRGDALVICETHCQPIDLMITDVVMPHFSGRQLAERLATRQPMMKVLFMSGYTDDAIVHHGVLESGMPFLQKPFAPESLLRKVRELLDDKPGQNVEIVPENKKEGNS